MVHHSTPKLKTGGSNQAAGPGREKMVKKVYVTGLEMKDDIILIADDDNKHDCHLLTK